MHMLSAAELAKTLFFEISLAVSHIQACKVCTLIIVKQNGHSNGAPPAASRGRPGTRVGIFSIPETEEAENEISEVSSSKSLLTNSVLAIGIERCGSCRIVHGDGTLWRARRDGYS